MFGFIKKTVFTGLTILSSVNPLIVASLNETQLKCVSMTNQECKVRQLFVNFNSNESVFYHFSIKTRKCSCSCNNINDPYTKMCVPDVVENLNVKLFNLPRTNEKRHIKWHDSCKCKCRLDAGVCNKTKME